MTADQVVGLFAGLGFVVACIALVWVATDEKKEWDMKSLLAESARNNPRNSPCGQWIAANDPLLNERLSSMRMGEALDELNFVTGLNIPGSAPIADTLPLFLEELKKIKREQEGRHLSRQP